MPRIVCISDTHNQHRALKIPAGDILIHAGDQSAGTGDLMQIEDFNAWMGTLDFKHKIVIAGNHDFLFQEHPTVIRRYAFNYTYLEDEAYEAEGLKFWGSPWQPAFFNWAFNLPRKGPELKTKWNQIPVDTSVLITHGPPYGYLDKTSRGELAGCEVLENKIHQLKRLKLHVSGHIHEGYGTYQLDDLTLVNASVLDNNYRLKNQPIVVDL